MFQTIETIRKEGNFTRYQLKDSCRAMDIVSSNHELSEFVETDLLAETIVRIYLFLKLNVPKNLALFYKFAADYKYPFSPMRTRTSYCNARLKVDSAAIEEFSPALQFRKNYYYSVERYLRQLGYHI